MNNTHGDIQYTMAHDISEVDCGVGYGTDNNRA